MCFHLVCQSALPCKVGHIFLYINELNEERKLLEFELFVALNTTVIILLQEKQTWIKLNERKHSEGVLNS